MSLTKTFDEIRWLDKDDAVELLSAALEEPYEEIQKQAIVTLFDERLRDKAGIIFKYFDKLLPSSREYIVTRKWNIITTARFVLTTNDENMKLLACKALSFIGGPDVANTLAVGLRDTSTAVRDKAVALLETIIQEFSYHLSKIRTSQESKSYVNDNKDIIIEALDTIVSNFERHNKDIFIKIILELGSTAYNLISKIIIEPNTAAHYALLREISNTDSEPVVELLFKLAHDRDERVSQFAINVFNNKRGQAFLYTVSQYINKLSSDNFNAFVTRMKSDYLSPAIKEGENIDNATAKQLVTLIVKANINEDSKTKALLNLLKAKSHTVCMEALNGLKDIKYPDILPICYEMLNNDNDRVKFTAAEIISQLNPTERIRVLTPLLNTEDEYVREMVAKYLSDESFERLILSFDRLDHHTREQAANALAKLDKSMTERLTAEINSLEPDRRIKALKITELIGREKELKRVLAELINDADRKVRATAIKTLGLAGGFDALSIVVNLLKDTDSRIRANAIEAIEEIGDNRLTPIIEPFVNDPDNRVRANAIKALWTLDKRDIIEEIKSMLLSPNDNMKISAIWVISQIKCQEGYEILREALVKENNPAIMAKIEEVIKRS